MVKLFTKVASVISHAAGHPAAFIIAASFILAWALCGPLAGFSENWQLVVNTLTTIVTFLMVFVLQNTQNRDTTALHAKLDEMIRSSSASNAFIGIEHLSEDELEQIRKTCEQAASRSKAGHPPG